MTINKLERISEAAGFFQRWKEAGFRTISSVALEVGVSLDTAKAWSCGKRPVPNYAYRALMRVERD